MGIITLIESHLRPSRLPHFCPTRRQPGAVEHLGLTARSPLGCSGGDILPEIRLAGERTSAPRATFRDRPSLMPSANSRRLCAAIGIG
jgi:hypothetical protein